MIRRFLSGEGSIWRSAIRDKSSSFVVLFILAMAMSGVCLMAYAQDSVQLTNSDVITRRDHQAIVDAIESQMEILKWIGGAIVAALASAVALLFRSLEKSNVQTLIANAQTHTDLVEGINKREEWLGAVVEAIEKLEDKRDG